MTHEQTGRPDQRARGAMLRQLAENHDDRYVMRELRAGEARDALNGSPVQREVYRVSCGHLVEVIGAELPANVTRLFCGHELCRVERPVVEHLT